MSEFDSTGLPDLGHISTIKDSCREKCPEDRPAEAEAMLRQGYEGAGQDLQEGIDPDLLADAHNLMPTSQQEAILAECFRQCGGPLKNRLGLGRAVCGQAINELQDRLQRGE